MSNPSNPRASFETLEAIKRKKSPIKIDLRNLPITKIPAGTKVKSRDRNEAGRTTGGTRYCTLEGCRGLRLGVRWTRGNKTSVTFPCSKGLTFCKHHLQIV